MTFASPEIKQWFLATLVSTTAFAGTGWPQAQPLASGNLAATYQRLLQEIEHIKIFDHHAHPAFPDDSDVDAMAAPPGSSPLRLRATNPELVAAAKALFDYPYSDFAPEHARWLVKKKAELRKKGPEPGYFSRILDQVGIETSIANRVAMASYLDAARFRWVFFVDCFFYPFENTQVASRNPDEGVYIPLQEKLLRRYLQQAGLNQSPADFADYLSFITRILEENKLRGGVAIKFEAAYFRSLRFEDPSRETASTIYEKYRAGGAPSAKDYKAFQDFVFRHVISAAGRLNLPVHIHTAVGIGDYFSLQNGNVLNLENVLRDPRYANVTFVLIHGGYPYDRQAIWLAALKNVYLDTSETELLLYPSEFKHLLKQWLEVYPEKITFGSDAFPYNEALGAEETYWLAVRSSRTALAAALAEMVASGEISETKALEMARGYLHDNAARLYERAGTGAPGPGTSGAPAHRSSTLPVNSGP